MVNPERADRDEESPEQFRRLVLQGWLIVFGIAVAFVLYGLFAFFVIGDQQSGDWQFGEMEDIPGESVYSTFPYEGQTEELDVQHIDRKPPKAETTLSDHPPPPVGSQQKGFQETLPRGGPEPEKKSTSGSK